MDKHNEALFEFASRLIDGENGRMLYDNYRDVIEKVTAVETMDLFDRLISSGYEVEKVKANAGKLLNLFYKPLDSYKWDKPGEGHFLHYMMLENRAVEKVIDDFRPLVKGVLMSSGKMSDDEIKELRTFIERLGEYELHYIKKENILFPFVEKEYPGHRCLQVMWSFHDDFRKNLKSLRRVLASDDPDRKELNILFGELFFVVLPIIFREEQIVYPVALGSIPADSWDEMLEQSVETGWCYGVSPLFFGDAVKKGVMTDLIDLETGLLSTRQIIMMLNHLPVDITFVDENDEVKYFSYPEHRIFPRSKAVIGRKVQNCHPPESVHLVNRIIEEFRGGKKDHADFWITMKGRFIHIRYFAVRDGSGAYRGTLEVSQDVTDIRSLEGEKRLLDQAQG